jgi:predicted PurR-regulated permease PerM
MNERFQSLVYGVVFAMAVGWVLHVGKKIFEPVVLSILVVYVIVGLTRLLYRIPVVGPRIPMQVNYALSIVVIALALMAMASLIMTNLTRVATLAPQYQATLLNMIQKGAARFGFESEPTWATLRRDLLGQVNMQRLIGSTVMSVTSIAASLIVVFLYVAFLVVEKGNLPNKLAHLSDQPHNVAQLEKIIVHINQRVGTYLALKTLLSLLIGLVSWAIMAFFGLELAAFWAVLITLLNYVPYIGSFLSVFLPVAFAVVQYGDTDTVLMLALALAVPQFFIGNFLDPYLMGNSLNLSPFAILISLTVWSALWGIPGAFLAVPITACLAMVFSEFPGTRPIAVLLSRSGDLDEN